MLERSQRRTEYIKFGVPQGFVVGPMLFVLYTADLAPLIADHCLHSHLYADDTQVYGWSPPSDASTLPSQHVAVHPRCRELDV